VATERREQFIETMRPINEALLQHSILTTIVAIGLLFIVVTNQLGGERDGAAGWLTWVVAALVVASIVATLAFPRLTEARPDQVLLNLLALSMAPGLIAWAAMALAGTPAWLTIAGFLASAVLIVVEIVMARRSSRAGP
jgi:hypothetical protein